MLRGVDDMLIHGISYAHVCLGRICMVLLFHACLPYWDLRDLGTSTGLFGWDRCDLHGLHIHVCRVGYVGSTRPRSSAPVGICII